MAQLDAIHNFLSDAISTGINLKGVDQTSQIQLRLALQNLHNQTSRIRNPVGYSAAGNKNSATVSVEIEGMKDADADDTGVGDVNQKLLDTSDDPGTLGSSITDFLGMSKEDQINMTGVNARAVRSAVRVPAFIRLLREAVASFVYVLVILGIASVNPGSDASPIINALGVFFIIYILYGMAPSLDLSPFFSLQQMFLRFMTPELDDQGYGDVMYGVAAICVQLGAGIGAGYLSLQIMPTNAVTLTQAGPGVTEGSLMVFEFLFVFAFAMAVNLLIPRHGVKSHALIYHSSPSAVIGAIFALANLFIVNLTGASMIFTRTLTAEIIQNNYTQWWWYFVPHLVAHFIAAVVLYSIPHLEKRRAVKAGLAMLNKRG